MYIVCFSSYYLPFRVKEVSGYPFLSWCTLGCFGQVVQVVRVYR